MSKTVRVVVLVFVLGGSAFAAWKLRRGRTVEDVVAGRPTPSSRDLTLVAFKEERRLEVWVDGRLERTFAILGASGGAGPKRREGDLQVPEGIYRLTTLNPESRHHLSIRVDYPDAEDRRLGFTGGDIYVHGGSASIGCIAIGNDAVEEVFRLAAKAANRRILIVPWDLRRRPGPSTSERWLAARYERLKHELPVIP